MIQIPAANCGVDRGFAGGPAAAAGARPAAGGRTGAPGRTNPDETGSSPRRSGRV